MLPEEARAHRLEEQIRQIKNQNTTTFALYEPHTDAELAEYEAARVEGKQIIRDFLQAWGDWQDRHRHLGARDTACRDEFWKEIQRQYQTTGLVK